MGQAELYVITGASRGLGAALADALIAPQRRLVCLARGSLASLAQRASERACTLDALAVDLADAAAAGRMLERALSAIDLRGCVFACLINNAGVVEPVGNAETLGPDAIAASVAVNLAAPMTLCSAFLHATAPIRARKILNITSGAGHTAYEGWSVYCATKAGLDHYSRCLALEQRGAVNGARVAALAPGVLDTAMQAAVRGLSSGVFKQQARFVELHRSGQLTPPRTAAADIIAYLHSDDFGSEPVVDIRTIHH